MDRERKFLELMNADLFILMSKNENFANVVIESLHMGTPVFISESVALADFVKKEDLGWTTALDIDAIVLKLKEIHVSNEKMVWVNNNSRKVIANSFSEPRLINDYIVNYKIIANKI
jgi:glycosyltransferase involved in cell wall biosynthesis